MNVKRIVDPILDEKEKKVILQESLNKFKEDITDFGVLAIPKDQVLDLIKEYELLVKWEEESFKQVEEVIKATEEFSEYVDTTRVFPESTLEVFKLCKKLIPLLKDKKEKKTPVDEFKTISCSTCGGRIPEIMPPLCCACEAKKV